MPGTRASESLPCHRGDDLDVNRGSLDRYTLGPQDVAAVGGPRPRVVGDSRFWSPRWLLLPWVVDSTGACGQRGDSRIKTPSSSRTSPIRPAFQYSMEHSGQALRGELVSKDASNLILGIMEKAGERPLSFGHFVLLNASPSRPVVRSLGHLLLLQCHEADGDPGFPANWFAVQ
jgi:hypothetical protein